MRKLSKISSIHVMFNLGIAVTLIATFSLFAILLSSIPMDLAKSVNDFADVISGFLAPATVIFLILNYLEQKKALKEAQEENRKNLKRSELSVFLPIYYDIMKSNYGTAFAVSEFKETTDIMNMFIEFSHSDVDVELMKKELDRLIKEIKRKISDDDVYFYRSINSYFNSYMALKKLYGEGFDDRYTWEWSNSFQDKSPLDETNYGYVGRRLTFFLKAHDLLKEAVEYKEQSRPAAT